MLAKFSVKKPYTVLVGVVLVIVLGIVSFTKMTTDLLPSLSLPYVIVMTPYPGASPETVEMVVTKPVESSMATVSNIENISSVSSENYSMVILEFAQDADMNAVSFEIRENLDQIKSYWDDMVGSPIIMKLNPDMLPIIVAAVGVEGMDNAQVSSYVENDLIPELESLEGVASVSATGLLKESVHVVISQEKIDAVNQKVFAAIDEQMVEAEQELEDGLKEIQDGKAELADGKAELADGQKELDKGKKELEDGEKELKDAQDSTKSELAQAKTALLTAKADLESVKMTLTTDLASAKAIHTSIAEIDQVLGASAKYQTAFEGMMNATVTSGDAQTAAKHKADIEALKTALMKNTVLTKMAASNEQMKQVLDGLGAMDWTDSNNYPMVQGTLGMLTAQMSPALTAQKTQMSETLNNMTMGMGYAAYEKQISATLKTTEEQLVQVNNGLTELEKGEMTAVIEFANANAQIQLGKYQMEVAQGQLDSAKEQLKTGEEQLDDALEQIEDGKEQLAEAKEDAYAKADMVEIITVDLVKNLLTAQNFSMPAGYVTEDGVDYLVRIGDKPSDVEQLKAIPLMDLHMDGVPVILLEDVADVFYTDNSSEIYTNVNGSAGVMLSVQKQTGYSTGEVSDLLLEEFDRMMETDPNLDIVTLSDQGVYIDLVMDSVWSNILSGGVLAVVILIFFLKDIRPTLVIACSIPISIVTALVCMYFSGVTMNVISLSGLALGIGMLVDNSIVVIENIYRLRSEGVPIREAAITGAKEVAGAIAASTLTTICVFLPIVFMDGITKQLFVDMGLTIAYSLLASLLIALTVVPAMSSKVLRKAKVKGDGKVIGRFTNAYVKLLKVSLKVKPLVLILVVVLLVVSIAAAFTNGTAFMSDMDSTQLTVSVQLGEEATLEDTARVTDQVVDKLMEMEDVSDVGAMVNSSSMASLTGAGASDVTSTTIYVTTREDKTSSNDELAVQIMGATQELDAEIVVNTASMDMSALGGSGISIQIQGKELDEIQRIAQEVAAILESVEGTAMVSDGLEEANEELRILIDREKAAEFGLTVAQVYTEVYSRLAEATSATTLVGTSRDYDVYVKSDADMALTRELLKSLEVDGTDEEGSSVKVPLSDIAEFTTAQALSSINRSNQNRYVSVSAAIADGYNVGLVSTEVEEALSDYEVPEGYKLVFSGENEMINEAMEQVMLMLVLALIFMYLIMVAQFQSLLSPFIIMFTIPLAFTGGFMALFVAGSEISVIAMIGFVMLSGIIVNNGIVIIDYMNQLMEAGRTKYEAMIEAGRTRLRPVLMTAITTILGLSTMAFSQGMGAEMAKPMAIVTIGGLTYGTLLTLVVIPCIYDYFVREKKADVED